MFGSEFAEFLLEQCAPIPFCGCWVWLGELNRNGYGRVWYPKARKRVMVHIATFRGLRGDYTPGLLLDHTCRVRSCCWPWHLEPVTPRENTLRGEAVLFKSLTIPPTLILP